MREKFVDVNFRDTSLRLIATCDQIIGDYQRQGYTLTLRQLYYQLVSRNIIPNEERSYKNVGKLVSQGRLAGLLDWDGIEDRVRVPRIPTAWDNPRSIMDAVVSQYRLHRWEGQPSYVELWVEKDALAGVLQPIANAHHVPMMVNRGYSSQSAMYDAAERFLQAANEHAAATTGASNQEEVRDGEQRREDGGAPRTGAHRCLPAPVREEHGRCGCAPVGDGGRLHRPRRPLGVVW